MDNNLNVEKKEQVQGAKVDAVAVVKNRIADLRTHLKSFLIDPKNRKVILLAAGLLVLVLMLIMLVVVSLGRGRQKEVNFKVQSSPTPTATQKAETLEDKLKSLRDEINLGFEDRSLLPPEIEFDIEFSQ